MGLVAPRHVRSSQKRDQVYVLCIGRHTAHHQPPREVPLLNHFKLLGNHHHIHLPDLPSWKMETLYPLNNNPSLLPPEPLTDTILLSISTNSPILDALYKWTHTVFVFLCCWSLSIMSSCFIHIVPCVRISCTLGLMFHYYIFTTFAYPFICEWILGLHHLLALMNNTDTNTNIFLSPEFQFFWEGRCIFKESPWLPDTPAFIGVGVGWTHWNGGWISDPCSKSWDLIKSNT